MVKRFWFAGCLLVAACSSGKYTPSPGMASSGFDADSAKCHASASGGPMQGVYAATPAGAVGAVIGNAIAYSIKVSESYDKCMQDAGWVPEGGKPKPPPAVLRSVPLALGFHGTASTSPPGILVTSVDISEPASIAGIAPGDIITAVAGQKVASMDDLHAVMLTVPQAKFFTISLMRGAISKTVQAKVG